MRPRGQDLLARQELGPPADTEALERVLVSLSDMVMNHPEISELDINSLMVYEKGKATVWQIAALSSKRPATGK